MIKDSEIVRILKFLGIRWLSNYWTTWTKREETRSKFIRQIEEYKREAKRDE